MKLNLKSFLVGSIVAMAFVALGMTFAAGVITHDFGKFYELASAVIVSGLVGGAVANVLVSSHVPGEGRPGAASVSLQATVAPEKTGGSNEAMDV